MADRIFSPCYIGGWSACQHWSLTDQVFPDGPRRDREEGAQSRSPVIQGTPVSASPVRSEDKLFGTTPSGVDQARVQVSDPTRTIVDVLDDPRLGGGMRNVADVLHEYFTGCTPRRRAARRVRGPTRQPSRVQAAGLSSSNTCTSSRPVSWRRVWRGGARASLRSIPPWRQRDSIVRRWGIRANVTLGRAWGRVVITRADIVRTGYGVGPHRGGHREGLRPRVAAVGDRHRSGPSRRPWVFKGGTCLKKCYIETYRFSEDLDFTVLPGGPFRPARHRAAPGQNLGAHHRRVGHRLPDPATTASPSQWDLDRRARVLHRPTAEPAAGGGEARHIGRRGCCASTGAGTDCPPVSRLLPGRGHGPLLLLR